MYIIADVTFGSTWLGTIYNVQNANAPYTFTVPAGTGVITITPKTIPPTYTGSATTYITSITLVRAVVSSGNSKRTYTSFDEQKTDPITSNLYKITAVKDKSTVFNNVSVKITVPYATEIKRIVGTIA
jgi:hypothetical protein